MSTIDKAIEIALKAHTGVKDKAGSPYILHPLRVMMNCPDELSKIAALLHDVVEDSGITLEDLAGSGFSPEIVTAVNCLTRREGENYDGFIRRAAFDPIARKVKIQDIEDNLNILRIEKPTANDFERIKEYRDYHRYLKHIDEITRSVTVGKFCEKGPLGRLCVRVFLIPKGVPFTQDIPSNSPGVINFVGWCYYTEKIPEDQFEPVYHALRQSDTSALYRMNPNWAPFYCPECNENYCKESWITVFLDDNYTVTEGRCPKGHRRILED